MQFIELPEHPITHGVEPFAINDEWYYPMRFRAGMEDVTPILTAVPPEETLSRPDSDRAFGFTGGHVHWNWGHEGFRKLVLNAIVWVASAEVPSDGMPSQPLTVEDLEANQDYPPPENFDRERIGELLRSWRE